MRIHFERTGGFAGPAMKRAVTVDADQLPAEEAAELRTLLTAADLSALARPAATAEQKARPDAFHYRLTIEVAGKQHTLDVSDTTMPPVLRPLVKWLTARASRPGA